MKILYHTTPEPTNAMWYLDHGYINAFLDMGHEVVGKSPVDVLIFFFHPTRWKSTLMGIWEHIKQEYGTKIVVWGSPFNIPKGYSDEYDNLHPPEHIKIMESGLIDLCLTWYPKEGVERYYRRWTEDFGIPVLSLPFAADATVFRPHEILEPNRFDMCYIGGIHRTKEAEMHRYIRPLLKDHQLLVSGKGWENWPVFRKDISYGEEAKYLSACRVVPNVHMKIAREVPGMAPNMRLFQAIACQAFVVNDNVPAIYDYFEPNEVFVAKDVTRYKGLVDIATWGSPSSITKAYEHLIREHTYHHRVNTLLEKLCEL